MFDLTAKIPLSVHYTKKMRMSDSGHPVKLSFLIRTEVVILDIRWYKAMMIKNLGQRKLNRGKRGFCFLDLSSIYLYFCFAFSNQGRDLWFFETQLQIYQWEFIYQKEHFSIVLSKFRLVSLFIFTPPPNICMLKFHSCVKSYDLSICFSWSPLKEPSIIQNANPMNSLAFTLVHGHTSNA